MSLDGISPNAVKKVMKELQDLNNNPPEGISVLMDETNISNISANISGPDGTPYEGGSFSLKIVLGDNFPDHPPKCYFTTKIFHPNVSRNGDVCVNTLKKDWKKDLGISHILLTVKCLLIDPNPESALNEEAGKLLLERYDEYAKHARLWTKIHASSKKLDSENNQSLKEQHSEVADSAIPKLTTKSNVRKSLRRL